MKDGASAHHITIREITSADQGVIEQLLREHWGDRRIVSRGKVLDAVMLPGFIAARGETIVGLITLHAHGEACEVVTLDAFVGGEGIGAALLHEAERFAITHNCRRLWLITTNDNVGALAFYQKQGLRIVAVHSDAVSEARKIKPQIPLVAENGIAIRDEIELERVLKNGV